MLKVKGQGARWGAPVCWTEQSTPGQTWRSVQLGFPLPPDSPKVTSSVILSGRPLEPQCSPETLQVHET